MSPAPLRLSLGWHFMCCMLYKTFTAISVNLPDFDKTLIDRIDPSTKHSLRSQPTNQPSALNYVSQAGLHRSIRSSPQQLYAHHISRLLPLRTLKYTMAAPAVHRTA